MHLITRHQNTWRKKLTEIKGEIHSNILTVDFNITLSITDKHTYIQHEMRECEHHRPDGPDWQMKLFHLTVAEQTFFSTAQRTFSRITTY